MADGAAPHGAHRLGNEHPHLVRLVGWFTRVRERVQRVRQRRDVMNAAIHPQLLPAVQRHRREDEGQRATRQHGVHQSRVLVTDRVVATGQEIDVADPEADGRRGHARRVEMLLEHAPEWRQVVETRSPPEHHPEGAERTTSVDVAVAAEAEPH